MLVGSFVLSPRAHAEEYPRYPYPYPYAYPYAPVSAPVTRVLVYRASSDAELQVHDVTGWRRICTGSCTTNVFVGARYRVAGERISTSRTFVVPAGLQPIALRADVGSTGQRTVGIILISVGAAAMFTGTLLVVQGGGTSANDDEAMSGAGIVVSLAGTACLVTGIVLLASGSTGLEFRSDRAATAHRVRIGKGLELTGVGLAF